MQYPDKCLRGRCDCKPLSQIESDFKDDFICIGMNKPETRNEVNDIFTICWKSEHIDERTHWDQRDIYDHISVLANGLSIWANDDYPTFFNLPD